jgi:cell division protein FtsI (penicillin-binding protein 3)
MLSLFEHGFVQPKDTVDLNKGRTLFYDETMEDASSHGLYRTSVAKAFELSSNVGIAKLANKYYNKNKASQEKFINFLRALKFEQSKLGFDGEGSSFIKDPQYADWSGITIPWMSIGYESYLTPLQTLNLYNTIANNGRMMRPQLVKEIRSYGHADQVFGPQVIDRSLLSKQTVVLAKELLESVVNGTQGTAKNIRAEHYKIAGKTGTSIINYKQHKASGVSKKYRSSFAGYFPADNPKYSCIVVVTNPRSGFYGGRVAAPVFRAIADNCYAKTIEAHKAINTRKLAFASADLPDLQVGYKQDYKLMMQDLKMPFVDESATLWSVSKVEDDTLQLLSRNFQEKTVPNVVGMGLRDALYLLENAKIRVVVKGVGKVRSQSVKPGRSVNDAPSITLFLG